MKKSFIEGEKLSFSYDSEIENLHVLKDLDFSIEKGEFVAILGHNGCGKSTLAKHFNAILKPSSGTIFVDGFDILDDDLVFEIRKRVGMVFQNPDNQIVATLVEEDVAFAPENLGIEPSEIRKRVDETLRSVDMYEYRKKSPSQLSGGQKQRVAIAGVLAMNPSCIVFDEATAMLDPKGRKEVMDIILRLNKENQTTIVHITHFMEEAVLADRIIIMNEGEILKIGTPKEIFSDVKTLNLAGLDVPQVTKFAMELEKEGILKTHSDVLNTNDCADMLYKLLEG